VKQNDRMKLTLRSVDDEDGVAMDCYSVNSNEPVPSLRSCEAFVKDGTWYTVVEGPALLIKGMLLVWKRLALPTWPTTKGTMSLPLRRRSGTSTVKAPWEIRRVNLVCMGADGPAHVYVKTQVFWCSEY